MTMRVLFFIFAKKGLVAHPLNSGKSLRFLLMQRDTGWVYPLLKNKRKKKSFLDWFFITLSRPPRAPLLSHASKHTYSISTGNKWRRWGEEEYDDDSKLRRLGRVGINKNRQQDEFQKCLRPSLTLTRRRCWRGHTLGQTLDRPSKRMWRESTKRSNKKKGLDAIERASSRACRRVAECVRLFKGRRRAQMFIKLHLTFSLLVYRFSLLLQRA